MDAYFGSKPLLLLKQDALRGRFVVAARDIKEGEQVLLARALLTNITDSLKKRVCGYCLRFAYAGRLSIKCSRCSRVFYCSPRCAEEHRHGHAALCGLIDMLPPHKFDHETTTMLQLLLEVYVRRWQASLVSSPHAGAVPHVGESPGGIDSQLGEEAKSGAGLDDAAGGAAAAVFDPSAAPVALARDTTAPPTNSTDVLTSARLPIPLPFLPPIHPLHWEAFEEEQQQLEKEKQQQQHQLVEHNSEVGLAELHLGMADATDRAESLKEKGEEERSERESLPPKAPKAHVPEAAAMDKGMDAGKEEDVKEAPSPVRPRAASVCRCPASLDDVYSPVFADYEMLCSHEGECDKGLADKWNKPIAYLQRALKEAGFPLVPSVSQVFADISRIESNSFAMYGAYAQRSTFLGRSVLPAASYFNHSCNPNIAVSVGQRVLAEFVAFEDIPAGAEVTISYIEWNLPRSTRQYELKSQYYFTCMCARCEEESHKGHGHPRHHITYDRGHSRPQEKRNHHRSRRGTKM